MPHMTGIPHNNVENVEEIRKIIQHQPTYWQEILKLPEDRTADDKYQIVEYSAVDYHQPKDNHQSLIINDNVISNNVN